MPRTTLDIDPSVLKHVKRIARTSGRSIGDVVSQLLALGLRHHEETGPRPTPCWTAKRMGARVDLEDKDAVYRVLDA